jgi:UPF0755 protein
MKRRSKLVTLFLFAVLVVLCLAALLFGMLLTGVPNQAAEKFGPPAQGIDFLQRAHLSTLLLAGENDLTLPNDPYGVERPFQVALGESTHTITERLLSEGFIPNAETFRTYLVYSGLDTTIQAGEYSLSPKLTALEIAQVLQDSTPSQVTFRILPGWRMEEIAAGLSMSGLSFTPGEFLISASISPQEYPRSESLEGFLYPDIYRFPREITVGGFISTTLENFQIKVDDELRAGFQRQGLDLYQALSLASIVQRESIVEDEAPLIASVFLNRLAAGMKLESDPTVQYALGYNPHQETWWTNPLSLENLQVDSPYNTYLYPGLPPGPISNPGLNALRGVAFPAQSPYYYFRSACDGSRRHSFAETFEEHVGNACP